MLFLGVTFYLFSFKLIGPMVFSSVSGIWSLYFGQREYRIALTSDVTPNDIISNIYAIGPTGQQDDISCHIYTTNYTNSHAVNLTLQGQDGPFTMKNLSLHMKSNLLPGQYFFLLILLRHRVELKLVVYKCMDIYFFSDTTSLQRVLI